MINSRSLDELTPETKDKCKAFIAGCLLDGIEIIITSTYRDGESQDALYAQGRTKPGAVVTRAPAGYSFHNWRVAFDFVPIKDGKAIWGDSHLWQVCGDVAGKAGLEWGGNWKFQDKPHCQNTGGKTIQEFIKESKT